MLARPINQFSSLNISTGLTAPQRCAPFLICPPPSFPPLCTFLQSFTPWFASGHPFWQDIFQKTNFSFHFALHLSAFPPEAVMKHTHRGFSCVESARRSIKNAQVSIPITRWCIRSQIKTLALFDTAWLIQHTSRMVLSVQLTYPRGAGQDILPAIF